jgi:hypothetical protein
MMDLFSSNNVVSKTVKLLKNNQKIETTLTFDEISYDLTKEMIIKNHYSHKWNTAFGKINIGVFLNEKLLGVATFGNLMNPNSYKNIIDSDDKDSLIELNRLWVDDFLGGNTETVLLSASWQIIKNKYKNIKAVQSFADGRLGVGTIYKASSFKYYGFEESLFFENVDTKETYHQVPFGNTKRPDGMIKLNSLWVQEKLIPFTVKTYRYIFPLYKDTKIKLQEKEFPKYEKGIEYINKSLFNFSNEISRSYILSEILSYKEKEILKNFVTKESVKSQMKNKSILLIAKERNVFDKLISLAKDYGFDYTEIKESVENTEKEIK